MRCLPLRYAATTRNALAIELICFLRCPKPNQEPIRETLPFSLLRRAANIAVALRRVRPFLLQAQDRFARQVRSSTLFYAWRAWFSAPPRRRQETKTIISSGDDTVATHEKKQSGDREEATAELRLACPPFAVLQFSSRELFVSKVSVAAKSETFLSCRRARIEQSMSKKRDTRQYIVINEERLITEVQRRPILYDKALKGYRKPTIRELAWQEVATLLESTGIFYYTHQYTYGGLGGLNKQSR